MDEIGDVVLFTPFLRELRRNFPKAWLSLVVKPGVANLVEKCPYVDEFLTFDCNDNKSILLPIRYWRSLDLCRRHLWDRNFDLALLPRWDVDNYHGTVLAYLSGATFRVGYSERVSDEKQRANRGFDSLLSHTLSEDKPKHELFRSLDMLEFIGGTVENSRPEIWLTQEDMNDAKNFLNSQSYNLKYRLIAFGPGASKRSRQWPLPSFIDVASELIKNYGAWIVVIGGKGEESLGQMIESRLKEKVINLVGKTTLRQAAALLSLCELYIGNDSGTKHLAAAMNVPVVEISPFSQAGPPDSHQSPFRFGPWGVPHRILQPSEPVPPCTLEFCTAPEAHCIRKISVEEVLRAIEDLIEPRMVQQLK